MKNGTSTRVTTTALKNAMAKRWTAPQHSLLWEVADSTGAQQTRRADALIMSVWPSRGIELHGVEIKTSRSDWRRELAQPAKSDVIFRQCHRWWLHTTPGVVADGELPTGWGLRVYDGDEWHEVADAALNEPEPMSMGFLASILRREEKDLEYRADRIAEGRLAEMHAQLEARISAEAERRIGAAGRLAAFAEAIEKETGLTLEQFSKDADAIKAARIAAAIMRSGLADQWGGLATVLHVLRDTADKVEQAMGDLTIEGHAALGKAPRRR